jgi:formate hydrogenlyase regulatory protein HycA
MIVGVAPPDRIPIKREAGYHTDQIGRHAQGQFLGNVIGEYLGGWRAGMDREDLRWYAYLHHFDDDGTYLWSDIEFVGLNVEGQNEVVGRAEALLTEWLSQLDDLVYGDIAVRLFQTRYDGIIFGLIDESDADPERGHGEDWVELYPDRLAFHAPWDGEYDT